MLTLLLGSQRPVLLKKRPLKLELKQLVIELISGLTEDL